MFVTPHGNRARESRRYPRQVYPPELCADTRSNFVVAVGWMNLKVLHTRFA